MNYIIEKELPALSDTPDDHHLQFDMLLVIFFLKNHQNQQKRKPEKKMIVCKYMHLSQFQSVKT